MMYKSCQFQIKNGRFIPSTETVEKMITYNQQYNILDGNSQLIVETDILIKPTNEQPKTVKHQTLIVLSSFNHQPFEIDEAVIALMFNLRHDIFEKIKGELSIIDDVGKDGEKVNYMLINYFPHEYNKGEFSCTLNKNLKFEDYNFQPPFNPNLLTGIDY